MTNADHGPPEAEPVSRGDVTVGDRDEARQSRLGREQVVAVRIEAALEDTVANREQLAFMVEEKAEAHRSGHAARCRRERVKAVRE